MTDNARTPLPRVALLLLAALLAPCVAADELPAVAAANKAGRPLFTESAFLIAATAAEIGSTRYALDHCNCREGNPLWGGNPSTTRMVLVAGGVSALQIFAAKELNKRGHRRGAKVLLIGMGVIRAGLAVHNMRQAR